MSKDEFLKIQTCVLKVNIHCDGCKHKVKKILQKIEGVYTTKIDSEQGKVTVSGNIDPNTLIKKLIKNGKHAEIWGAKPNNNNNQNHLNNQFKNLQIDHGGKVGGNGNKPQAQKGGGSNQQKGGGGGGGPPGHNQQMKGFQDMKMMPQFMKDMKMAPPNGGKDQNSKSVKFKLPQDEEMSDDDFDDEYDDDEDDFDDDELDDEMDHAPMKKPVMGGGHGHGGGGGGAQMPNVMMQNMMNGQLPQHMKPGGGNGGGGNGKKGGGGGGGNVPVQMNHGGGGGKKGGGGGNPNQGGGGGGGQKGGKNGGGGGGSQIKNGGGGGGGKGGGSGGHFMANGAKKGNDGGHGMPNMMAMNGGSMGPHMGMGQMGNPHPQMGQMGNLAAVQGLPASAMSGAGGPGYFPGVGPGPGPDQAAGNPFYQQQQLAAMMMNQQRANGNERFQPMMYARPPPAVNFMPPYPAYPYPAAPGERADQYSMFSDENTSSCSLM